MQLGLGLAHHRHGIGVRQVSGNFPNRLQRIAPMTFNAGLVQTPQIGRRRQGPHQRDLGRLSNRRNRQHTCVILSAGAAWPSGRVCQAGRPHRSG